MKDSIYATPRSMIADFAFDASVAAVFPDMIRRSVPAYGDIVALTGLIAGRYAQSDSNCYDLGCSLGASTLAMRRWVNQQGCRIIAVDSSEAMVERCRQNIEITGAATPVDVIRADIRQVPIEHASVVVMNFTLQFVPPEERDALLKRIYTGLHPGGVLLLAEKTVFDDPEEQAFQEGMHLAFKRANGYSELEISQKRMALEKVLLPDTPPMIHERLATAGFARHYAWHHCFNFTAFAAFK